MGQGHLALWARRGQQPVPYGNAGPFAILANSLFRARVVFNQRAVGLFDTAYIGWIQNPRLLRAGLT
eukprot:1942904-Alexandrium_andersonii.AAC.1